MARDVPARAVEEFTRQINVLSESMRSKLAEQLAQVDIGAPGALDVIQDLMSMYCGGATDAAALIAAQYYDAARDFVVGEPMGAQAVSQRVPLATKIAVDSIVGSEKGAESIMSQLGLRLDYEIKRAAGDCVFYNGTRDPRRPTYARVPSGSETCMFCLMLASRGFVYRTKKSAGELDHYHSNCDCRVVPSWGGSGIEGYDTDALYDKWQESMEKTARARAEKNGTTVADEKSKIYRQLEEGAKRAKQRNRTSTTSSVYIRPRQDVSVGGYKDIGTKPIRPKSVDFDDYDKLEEARRVYRAERDEFEKEKDSLIDSIVSAPSHGYDTRESVSRWAKSRGVVIDSDVFDSIDAKALDEIIYTNNYLMDKYPQVLSMYEDAGSHYLIKTAGVEDRYAFMEAGGGLVVNPSFFRTYRDVVEHVVDGYTELTTVDGIKRDLRYVIRGDGTFKTTITHEFGHNLDAAIQTKKFYGVDGVSDYAGLKQYNQELTNLTNRFTTSAYATTNTLEAFAEGFAEMECNPTSEYGIAFAEFLSRWL